MRRSICLWGAAVLCLGVLAACGAAAEQAVSSGQEGSAETQIIQKVYTKEYQSDDGKVLLGNYSYTAPVMTGVSDAEASETIADTFNGEMTAMVEDRAREWDEAMENAQAWYDESRKDEWEYYGHWTDESTCQMNATEEMVSLRFANYVYSGGAHGYTYYTGMLFDLREGAFVEIGELSDDPQNLVQTVSDEILRQIEEKGLVEQFGYWSDYADYVAQWSSNHSIFFNESNQMEIIFPAYELASYAAGEQFFSVEQSVYEPCLNDYGKRLLRIE